MQNQHKLEGNFKKYVERLVDQARTTEDTLAIYDDWAEDFDNDKLGLGYSLHVSLVKFLEKNMTRATSLTKSSSILELAVGTGLVGEQLRKKGFTGQIDAHDGSEKMLEIAKKKEVYKHFFLHILDPHNPLPPELSSQVYDIAIMCGGFVNMKYVHYDCVRQLLHTVRESGLIIYTVKKPIFLNEFEYRCAVDREAFLLEDKGYWQLMDMKLCNNFQQTTDEKKEKPSSSVYLYCYKKLKGFGFN